MAGQRGRGRNAKSIIQHEPDIDLPDMGEDDVSIIAFMRAVTRAVARRQLDARVADSLSQSARVALSAVRHRDTRADLFEMRQLVKDAEKTIRFGEACMLADRHHVPRPNFDEWTHNSPMPEAREDEEEGDGPSSGTSGTGVQE